MAAALPLPNCWDDVVQGGAAWHRVRRSLATLPLEAPLEVLLRDVRAGRLHLCTASGAGDLCDASATGASTAAWVRFMLTQAGALGPEAVFRGNALTAFGHAAEPLVRDMVRQWMCGASWLCGAAAPKARTRRARTLCDGGFARRRCGTGPLAGVCVGASTDGILADVEGRPLALLEIKAPMHRGYARPKPAHLLQMQQQMFCTGVCLCFYVAVCFAERRVIAYRVPFSEALWQWQTECYARTLRALERGDASTAWRHPDPPEPLERYGRRLFDERDAPAPFAELERLDELDWHGLMALAAAELREDPWPAGAHAVSE